MARASGKVAIVTGGSRGLGAAFARALIDEGAKVMLTSVVNTEEGQAMAASLGSNARYMSQDVASEAQWKRVVSDTEAAFGPVSVLVNNAGIITSFGPIETLEESTYRRTIDVNQIGVFLGMKSVLPSMKRAGGGSIINIASVAGLVGAANLTSYTASKFAVRGMTKCAAIEFAKYNIRVNSVHPGTFKTEAVLKLYDLGPESVSVMNSAVSMTAAGRLGEPSEVAAVVLMLATDEARYCTGAEFVVDGGQTCM